MAQECVFPPILKVVDKNYPVPLSAIDIKLSINGYIGNVESVLHFKNTESTPIEAVYEFPIDDQSAVYHFEAQIEDRVIVAECQEKKQAKETYDDAISAGYTATLLEEDDSASDIFRCLLGNLPAGVEATIKFAYTIELPVTPDGALQFVLPTQLNPRYNPSLEKGGTKTPVDVPYVMPGGDQPYKFTFLAKVFNPAKIQSVKSVSDKDEFKVTLSDDDRQAEVSLVSSFCPDHDLSLQVVYHEAMNPHVIIEKGDSMKDGMLQKDVVMLNFFPQLGESAFSNKHEFIFVIDRSGSMDGPRIISAKKALLIFLKSLPPGCYFNIVGFGSSFEFLFPDGSREYSEETLNLAMACQSNLEANFGGTEILEPLAAIYDKPSLSTHSRQILVLTDGEVSNTGQVIDLVRKNVSKARLFSFGIGEGASTSLVKGIARAGRGKAEFVLQDDQITGLVMKTLKAAMQASVTDLHLEWELGGSVKLLQVPRELPPLFAGDRLIVYAVNNGEQVVLDGKVQLKGKVGESSIQFSLNVSSATDTSQYDSSLPIHRLTAKAEIKHLQDSDKDDKNKSEIVVLSIAANITSKHTSMVGVDLKNTDKVVGDLVKRQVPLMMSAQSAYASYAPSMFCKRSSLQSLTRSRLRLPTQAYQPKVMMCCASMPIQRRSLGMSSAPVAMACMMRDSAPPPIAYDAMEFQCADAAVSSDVYMNFDDAMNCAVECYGESELSMEQKVPAPPATYVSVVELQAFNGSWKLNDQLASLTSGLSQQQLLDAAPIKALDVWATVIALALLTSKFADKKDEWEMIAMKARQWLDSQPLEGPSVNDLIELAAKLLTSA